MDQIFRDLIVDFAIDLHGLSAYDPAVRVGLCLTYRRKKHLRMVLERGFIRCCIDANKRAEFFDFRNLLKIRTVSHETGWSRPTSREVSDVLAFGPKTLEGIRLVQMLLNGIDLNFFAQQIQQTVAPFWTAKPQTSER